MFYNSGKKNYWERMFLRHIIILPWSMVVKETFLTFFVAKELEYFWGNYFLMNDFRYTTLKLVQRQLGVHIFFVLFKPQKYCSRISGIDAWVYKCLYGLESICVLFRQMLMTLWEKRWRSYEKLSRLKKIKYSNVWGAS